MDMFEFYDNYPEEVINTVLAAYTDYELFPFIQVITNVGGAKCS